MVAMVTISRSGGVIIMAIRMAITTTTTVTTITTGVRAAITANAIATVKTVITAANATIMNIAAGISHR